MNKEDTLVRICNECSAELPNGARYCPSCGADSLTGESRGSGASGESMGDMLTSFANGAVDEIKSITAPILKSETGRKVAAGATLGVVAAAVLPVVSVGLGAVVGAGVAAWRVKSQQE